MSASASSLAAPRVDARSAAVWLLLIAIVGGALTFGHGISKKFNDEWEYTQTEQLTYQASPMAFVFAAIMLPMVFAFARAEGAGTAEAWVLWYMLCACTYAKDFAYIRIPGIPLYITDYLLVFLLIGTFVYPRVRVPHPFRMPALGVLLLLVTGGIAALRGVLSGEDKILIARDYAMVAYSLFTLIVATQVRSWAQIKRLMLMLVMGSILMSFNGFGWLLNAPGQRRYLLYPHLMPAAFVWIIVGGMNHTFSRSRTWLAATGLTLGLFVANTRAEYFAVLVTVGCVVLLGASPRRGSLVRRLKALAAAALVGLVLVAAFAQTRAGEKLISRIVSDAASAITNPEADATVQFRVLMWGEALRRFVEQPVLGEGYGKEFKFEYWDASDSRPHNTYLTILYKSGVVGFSGLAFMLGHFLWVGLRRARAAAQVREAELLQALLFALFAMLLPGLFTFVFESPFIAAPVWIVMGAGYAGMKLLARRMTEREAAV